MPKVLKDSTALQIQELLRRPTGDSRPRGREPVMIPVVKCGELISSDPRPHYFGTVYWIPDLDGPVNATGAEEDTVILTGLNAQELTPGQFYHVVHSGTADDDEDNTLALFWVDSGASSAAESPGCDWVDALTEDDCLSFSLESAAGACGCFSDFTPLLLTYQSADDGGTWGTGDFFTGCGVKYIPTFKREACNGPCLGIANVPEGSTPCCDPEDEGTADAVNVTMTVNGVDYTGTLLLTGGCWTGELTSPPPVPPPCGTALSSGVPASGTTSGSACTLFSFYVTVNGTYKITASQTSGAADVELLWQSTCGGGSTLATLDFSGTTDCMNLGAQTLGTQLFFCVRRSAGSGSVGFDLAIGTGTC